ncbi:MAG TPA: hypothetical protein VMX35_04920 [Acidobacteriota bacterium]|nr:hypothetical protein [Acidobacteriota bacterium]
MKKYLTAAAALCLVLALASFAAQDTINWKTLIKYLPETFNGMPQSEEPEGMTSSAGGYVVSEASASYGDDEDGEVSIIFGTMAGAQFEALSQSAAVSYDSSDGYYRSTKIHGFPAVEQYDREDKSGTVMVMLPNKVIVTVTLDECEDTAICLSVVESMDLNGLANEKE